jgi:hypothetical protein
MTVGPHTHPDEPWRKTTLAGQVKDINPWTDDTCDWCWAHDPKLEPQDDGLLLFPTVDYCILFNRKLPGQNVRLDECKKGEVKP